MGEYYFAQGTMIGLVDDCENGHATHAECDESCACVGSGKSRIEIAETRADAAVTRVAELEKALRDLYGLVDSGWLVRDISRDFEDGWGMRQLRPVMILKAVAALVKKIP